MTASRDPDRLIQHFLAEGAEHLQDQVYDAVRADIEQQRQRAVIGPWRMPIMNKLVPIGVAAAAVVVALVVGTRLLGPPASSGVGAVPSVQASLAPSPTAAPSAVTPSATVRGNAPGPFVFKGVGDGPDITVTIPAPGWYGEQPDGGTLVKNDKSDPPDGSGMIGPWYGPLYVYGDPCQWSTTSPKAPVTTVDGLVAALTAQKSRDASAPVDITVDGYSGKSIILHVPDDASFGKCDQGRFGSWDIAAGTNDGPDRYHQGPGQIDELVILNVSGKLMVFDAGYYAGTPAGDLAELHAILDSMTFKK
ncbi:MAG: hypothetical protein H0U52_15760 [Chloroflexi bacterium]|nr:hypothetical protein [Chloroflexota bacterium]